MTSLEFFRKLDKIVPWVGLAIILWLIFGCATAPTKPGPCVMTPCGYECCNNDGKVCECRIPTNATS
jgi:hypothetical protein